MKLFGFLLVFGLTQADDDTYTRGDCADLGQSPYNSNPKYHKILCSFDTPLDHPSTLVILKKSGLRETRCEYKNALTCRTSGFYPELVSWRHPETQELRPFGVSFSVWVEGGDSYDCGGIKCVFPLPTTTTQTTEALTEVTTTMTLLSQTLEVDTATIPFMWRPGPTAPAPVEINKELVVGLIIGFGIFGAAMVPFGVWVYGKVRRRWFNKENRPTPELDEESPLEDSPL